MFWAVLATVALLGLGGSALAANTQTLLGPNAPHPTVTPQLDASVLMGLTKPTVAPVCLGVVGLHGAYGDGCVYACATNGRSIIAGSACAFPTP